MSSLPVQPAFDRRGRWPRLVAFAWLLALTVLAAINLVAISRLDTRSQTTAPAQRVQALAAQLADLAQQVQADKRVPAPATQAELAASRKTLEDRIAQLEQAQAASPKTDAVTALQSRLDALESRQVQAVQATVAAPRPKAAAPIKRVPASPPFRVVGVELRGAERFLTILPPGATALADVRLLRVGAAEGAWQLQTIAAHEAVFQVNGVERRVALP